MNTKTEETRHAMYQHLEGVKKTIKKGFSPRAKMSDFESAIEEHLEALRQEYEFMKLQLMNCRQANTDIQLRLHAIDHAYFVQSQANIAAGDQLRDAQALIQRQRGAIADMYMASRSQYWLCCGSTDPHHDKNKKSCHEARQGHEERCRFGTAEQHSEWQKVKP